MKRFNPVRVARIFRWISVLAVVTLPQLGNSVTLGAQSPDPELANANTNWSVTVGAQSPNATIQAMAFLPNEIWIDAGDSVTWQSNTGEAHTVSFLLQPEAAAVPGSFPATAQTRPSFNAAGPAPFGCAGNNQGGTTTTPTPFPYTGAYGTECVNSGPICINGLQPNGQPDDACPLSSYTVTFSNPGDYKLVCLIHSDMTGVVHVLALATPYPHDQTFYNDEANDQAQKILEKGETTPVAPNREVLMTGELLATGGGKQYLAIMRFLPDTITVRVGDTVQWTNQDPDEPHTVTILPPGGTEPPPAGPASTPGGIPDPHYSAVDGTIPNAVGCGVPGATCFSSGLIGPANQDQTGLPQTPTGVQRARVTFTAAGVYNYYCILHDDLGMLGKVIVLGNTRLTVTPGTLASGTTGVAYSQQLVASGGTPPYNWIVVGGAIPPGLTLSAGGLLSGTPTSPFLNNFYVEVSDSGGQSVTPGGYYFITVH
jgi:plastocyanin